MSAPKGNQFWKLRAKHGRDKLFESPETLWDAACEYFQWVDDNPFKEEKPMVVSGGFGQRSEVKMVEIPRMRPYTLHGLCLHLNCNTAYFRQFKAKCTEDFSTVIGHIQDVIYTHKFEGAAAGFFNANIISRDLGLKDSTDITSAGLPVGPVITTMIDGKAIDLRMD